MGGTSARPARRAAALILAALPVIVFYAIFQKQILKGIADGAVKG